MQVHLLRTYGRTYKSSHYASYTRDGLKIIKAAEKREKSAKVLHVVYEEEDQQRERGKNCNQVLFTANIFAMLGKTTWHLLPYFGAFPFLAAKYELMSLFNINEGPLGG